MCVHISNRVMRIILVFASLAVDRSGHGLFGAERVHVDSKHTTTVARVAEALIYQTASD